MTSPLFEAAERLKEATRAEEAAKTAVPGGVDAGRATWETEVAYCAAHNAVVDAMDTLSRVAVRGGDLSAAAAAYRACVKAKMEQRAALDASLATADSPERRRWRELHYLRYRRQDELTEAALLEN